MNAKTLITLVLAVLLIGAVSGVVYSYFSNPDNQMPLGSGSVERISPYNHIKEDQIHVGKDNIIISLENAFWARFADTNSMDPIIDINTNTIEIKPINQEQVHVGDIISYKFNNDIIIHRVIDIKKDEQGIYYLTKGDNLEEADPLKVRFDQVNGIVVAVIY